MSRIVRRTVGQPSPDLSTDLLRNAQLNISDTVLFSRIALLGVLVIGIGLRLYNLNLYGFNTDEAVYAGQAAGILNNEALQPYFPVFRAHPLLFQFTIALVYRLTGISDLAARLTSVGIGAVTLLAVYVAGKLLYNRGVGVLAALFMALMPYHIIVTRQVLLDGPMTLFATLTLCAMARFGQTQQARWLYLAGVCLGLTFLAKEAGIIFIGSIYLFLARSPKLKVNFVHLTFALVLMAGLVAIFPLAITLSGAGRTGQSYLIWQLLRRPNHEWWFYLANINMIGLVLIFVAIAGLIVLQEDRSWRETLLVAWCLVPYAFFQIWPVKGFQYLLPIAPALAILAARVPIQLRYSAVQLGGFALRTTWFRAVLVGLIALTLTMQTLPFVQPNIESGALAGFGGLPRGREAGLWFSQNTPKGAEAMAIGPSIANPIQFYGQRKIHMLSISSNPLSRNPAYEAIDNPDLRLRNGEIQYIVWDRYSSERSPHFAERLMTYVKRFHGQVVHTETLSGQDIIVIYEVHP